jgi:carboxyl-terminal processing protease
VSNRRVVFEASLVVILGVAVGAAAVSIAQRGSDYAFFDELIEVKTIIGQRFVAEPDMERLRQGAIRGMVEALDDPYTQYVPAADQAEFNKDLTGEYVGIGAQVTQQDDFLTIVTPLEDSPAFRAGLMADDRVVEIDGKSTRGLTIDQCIDLLMGEPGTTVKLLIERKGERLDITITRDRIKTRAVKGFHRDESNREEWLYTIDPTRGIAYVRLTQFTPGCAREVLAALERAGVARGELKGLVLDLRFNPGGLLSEAEALADLFLREGTIVSTRGRAIPERVSRARDEGTLPNFPIAVLINGQSASASEVLAGALVENNRAITVGTRTFGKGSVQSVLSIPSGRGSEIKITEQGYYLPSGRSISRKDDAATWGVDPTDGFYVPMTDAQLVAMLDVRRREEILTPSGDPHGAPDAHDWTNPAWITEHLKDPQLSAALRAVQGFVDSGTWTPTGEPGTQAGRIASAELRQAELVRERLLRELERTERRIAALEDAAPQKETLDLWADSVDVSGGEIEIKDSRGQLVSRLRITGNTLERWLIDAGVEPLSPAPAKP